MNNDVIIIGSVAFFFVATGLGLFFTLNHQFRSYVREVTGKGSETTTLVSPQPLMISAQPTFADKKATEERFQHVERKIEESRVENKNEMQKLRDEATQGRNEIKHDINRVVDQIGDKLHDFALDITNKVGELRGEIRQQGNRKS